MLERIGRLNLAPGYQTKSVIDLSRAVEPACLQCHAGDLAGAEAAFTALLRFDPENETARKLLRELRAKQ